MESKVLLPLLQAVVAVLAAAAARPWQPDLGPYSMAITTASKEAQAAFDRGLNQCFNFNQPLARKAFTECAAADPTCAMCHWGLANAWGPFLNSPQKSATDLREARKAALKAAELVNSAGGASAKEYGLIAAMVERYPAIPTWKIPIHTYEAYEVRACWWACLSPIFPKPPPPPPPPSSLSLCIPVELQKRTRWVAHAHAPG